VDAALVVFGDFVIVIITASDGVRLVWSHIWPIGQQGHQCGQYQKTL
jgi:hypothetical protein